MFVTPEGKEIFVVDGHTHFWDGSPENQRNIHGKQFIECFYGYHMALSPPEQRWEKSKFEKYSADDLYRDLFIDGPDDVAIVQSTYLKDFYKEGFNTIERNFEVAQNYPDRFIVNGAFDPRDGEKALEYIHFMKETYDIKGVKLYTAEWNGDSKGWRLNDPSAYKCFELCDKLGIKNMHVHKGPTIIPLNKDAFDVHDVDYAATDFQNLNWIVEHCGLPRLDDFCWIAVQETNVYGGLAVALPFIHSPPALFRRGHRRAAVLGRPGEDPVRLGLRDLDAALAGREVLGLRAAGGHQAGARRRPHAGDQGEDPGPQRGASLQHRRRGQAGAARAGAVQHRGRVSGDGIGTRPAARARPRSGPASSVSTTPSSTSPSPTWASSSGSTVGGDRCGRGRLPAADLLVLAQLRLPDGRWPSIARSAPWPGPSVSACGCRTICGARRSPPASTQAAASPRSSATSPTARIWASCAPSSRPRRSSGGRRRSFWACARWVGPMPTSWPWISPASTPRCSHPARRPSRSRATWRCS